MHACRVPREMTHWYAYAYWEFALHFLAAFSNRWLQRGFALCLNSWLFTPFCHFNHKMQVVSCSRHHKSAKVVCRFHQIHIHLLCLNVGIVVNIFWRAWQRTYCHIWYTHMVIALYCIWRTLSLFTHIKWQSICMTSNWKYSKYIVVNRLLTKNQTNARTLKASIDCTCILYWQIKSIHWYFSVSLVFQAIDAYQFDWQST